jgi:hypothetical protein
VSAGTYDLEIAALLRKDFAAATRRSRRLLTIAGSGPTYTVTRAAGSWTDGVKKGDVIRLRSAPSTPPTSARTCWCCRPDRHRPDREAAERRRPGGGRPDHRLHRHRHRQEDLDVPTSGHTNDYFSWEKKFADLTRYELFTDVKPASADIAIPATGIATVNFGLVGLAAP